MLVCMMCHQAYILDNTLLRIATFTTRIIFWTEKLGLVFGNRADLQQIEAQKVEKPPTFASTL